MIGKRIRKFAPRRYRSIEKIRTVVNALTTYAIDADPQLVNQLLHQSAAVTYALDIASGDDFAVEIGEKVSAHGTRNLHGSSLLHHQQQMLAACLLAPSAKDPIEHYVFSFADNEDPRFDQIEELLDIFSAEMGYDQSPLMWAKHSNTNNHHIHIVVVRVDLSTRRAVTPGEGWEIERIHQVLALVEDRQGWRGEKNALYFSKDGAVFDAATGHVVRLADGTRDGCYKRRAVAPERGREAEHANVAEALRLASTWADLHRRLSLLDASYDQSKSGARIRIGEQQMRASDFGREFSFKRMCARHGEFQSDILAIQDPYEQQYKAAQRAERKRVNDALNHSLEQLRLRRHRALERAREKKLRLSLLVAEEQIALEFDLAERALRDAYDRARRTIASAHLSRDRWLRAGQPPVPVVLLPSVIFAEVDQVACSISESHGYTPMNHGWWVDYHDAAGQRAVTDHGLILIVHHTNDPALQLALALASQRSNQILVEGPEEFLKRCEAIALREGYSLISADGEVITPSVNAPDRSSATTHRQLQRSDQVGAALARPKSAALEKRESATQRDPILPTTSIPSRERIKPHETGQSKNSNVGLSDEVLLAAIKKRLDDRGR